ncbi:MAG: hypothetical protein LBR42_02225 [Candidatus Methanoplasma sp.]|jgi:hypothetical protein|nr:hypothetical protein [Candidatus Methanoplasma sp.]
MKVFSTHFVLKGKSDYKDLAPVFPDILKALLDEIGQMPEEEEILQMFIDMNMVDLERNRKPEGYNRKGKIRMIFPTDRKEFYLKSYSKTTDLSKMSDIIGSMLTSAGVKFDVVQNDRTDFD